MSTAEGSWAVRAARSSWTCRMVQRVGDRLRREPLLEVLEGSRVLSTVRSALQGVPRQAPTRKRRRAETPWSAGGWTATGLGLAIVAVTAVGRAPWALALVGAAVTGIGLWWTQIPARPAEIAADSRLLGWWFRN